MIVSAGDIVVSNMVHMDTANVRTFHQLVTAQMSPSSTILVWHVTREGSVVADSLTFPVEMRQDNNVSEKGHFCYNIYNSNLHSTVFLC